MRTLYRPLIAYSYEFSGVKYSGLGRIRWAPRSRRVRTAFAKKQVAKYPVGKILKVYVNPDNPSELAIATALSRARG